MRKFSLDNFKYRLLFKLLARNNNCYSQNNHKPRLFFGPIPLINNKYFSNSLNEIGFESKTVMNGFYSIHKKEDYDLYFENILINKKMPFYKKIFVKKFMDVFILEYLLENFDIFHLPYTGLIFSETKYKYYELLLLRKFNKKIVMMPFGSDSYMYSKIINESLKQVLMISYPKAGENEKQIQEHVNFWQANSDFRLGSIMIDGFSLWDILTVNSLVINSKEWTPKKFYADSNGINDYVNIIHTPNHRGFKGTEFLIQAINRLKLEGLKVNLILLEGIPNTQVREIMLDKADILAEQFIFIGYALSGIEGMATGIPVLSNLSDERYTRVCRRYAYLDECPILSTTPESIYDNLRLLVLNPKLREQLGRAGRKYVEKYHAYQTAQKMFSKIYDKIWYKKDVELWRFFHPAIEDSYNNQSPLIDHPLFENKIPEELMKTLNQ